MSDELEVLRASKQSLQFLTYDARDVVDVAGIVGLDIFDQVRLMCWCYNGASPERVVKAIEQVRGAVGGRRRKDETDLVAMVTPRSQGVEAKPDSIVMEEIGRNEARLIGKPFRQASFSAKAMRNLWIVDHTLLLADYYVRLDRLAVILDELSEESLRDLSHDLGRRSMGIVYARLEEEAAHRRERLRVLQAIAPIAIQGPALADAETIRLLDILIEELRSMHEVAGI